MALGGDLGGLYGAIVGIPSILLTFFAERLFQKAIAKLMTVKGSSQPSTLK